MDYLVERQIAFMVGAITERNPQVLGPHSSWYELGIRSPVKRFTLIFVTNHRFGLSMSVEHLDQSRSIHELAAAVREQLGQ